MGLAQLVTSAYAKRSVKETWVLGVMEAKLSKSKPLHKNHQLMFKPKQNGDIELMNS